MLVHTFMLTSSTCPASMNCALYSPVCGLNRMPGGGGTFAGGSFYYGTPALGPLHPLQLVWLYGRNSFSIPWSHQTRRRLRAGSAWNCAARTQYCHVHVVHRFTSAESESKTRIQSAAEQGTYQAVFVLKAMPLFALVLFQSNLPTLGIDL